MSRKLKKGGLDGHLQCKEFIYGLPHDVRDRGFRHIEYKPRKLETYKYAAIYKITLNFCVFEGK